MNWLGIDVGGANLKVADGRGYGESVAFPLWKTPGELAAALRAMLDRAPSADGIAATMTGELADCFATKRAGVKTIVRALMEAASERPLRVCATTGRMHSPQMAIDWPEQVAAANWHALGRFAAKLVDDESAILVDIGSTTADLIPLVDGWPHTRGLTDTERLVSGELVYTGVVRSPVCAIARSVPYRGHECPLAQELFATAWDAYLVLGDLPEEPENMHTADGRPATRAAARRRLARAVCADRTEFDPHDAKVVARAIADAQFELLEEALARVAGACEEPPRTCVISGQGEFLAERLVRKRFPTARVISLSEQLGPTLSRVAPAHALAVLANDEPGSMAPIRRVIKVGGSLLEWPRLASRLQHWLARYPDDQNVLIAGCGASKGLVREKQAAQALSDARAHWMCIGDMSVTAQALQKQLPGAVLCETLDELRVNSRLGKVLVFDVRRFLRDEEPRLTGQRLPESWDVSSDSIAARLADAWDADELVLLKSANAPAACIATAVEAGYVDPFFDRAWSQRMPLRFVNLRQRGFPAVRLAAAKGFTESTSENEHAHDKRGHGTR